jgi:acyl carrier protein
MPAETHSHRGPVDRAEVERIVREQLAEILEIDVDAITSDARLRDDLDADDYALIELAEAVEGELGDRMVGLTIDDEDLAEWHTVRDAVECIAAGLEHHADRPTAETPTAETADADMPNADMKVRS